MQPEVQPKKRSPLAILIFIGFFSLLAWALATAYLPNYTMVTLDEGPRFVLEGENLRLSPIVLEDRVLIPIEEVQTNLDPHLVWDDEGRVIVTTAGLTVRLRSDSLTAFVNQEPMELEIAMEVIEDCLCIPASLLETLYGVTTQYHPSTGTVTVDLPGLPVQTGIASTEAFVRAAPSIKSPVLSRQVAGSTLRIYGEDRAHYRVRTPDGLLGYVDKSKVTLGTIVTGSPASPPTPDPWRPMGERINLTWEHVITTTPEPQDIPEMPGLTVVSPTWFGLKDASGRVSSRADPLYVEWAHARGYRVWALVNNAFDPVLTSEVLRNPDARENFIRQVLAYAALFGLDGINVDFENMHMEDSDYFVQLLRELVPCAHEQGLVVSVDITVLSSNPFWSLCYDRKAIASIVDYVILMAYDQYAAGSPTPGPVASLPWTEWALTRTLEEVPPERLILGFPFYVRLWKEDAQGQVSSTAYGISRGRAIMEAQGVEPEIDEESGLLYGKYQENGTTYSAWLEDPESMGFRVNLVKEYGLAGVASWRRGLEPEWVWEVIAETLRGPL